MYKYIHSYKYVKYTVVCKCLWLIETLILMQKSCLFAADFAHAQLGWQGNVLARMNQPNMNCGSCALTFAHNSKHKYIRTSRNIRHVCPIPPETEFSLFKIVHLFNDIRVIKICNLHRSCSRKAFICL